ncbi:MAG TPA: tetratricopeptide repeat protein, partial [Streptosporangiaceae bacterium]|nr:tetratricopeptide repeat protein [Streptosporangiaceae bacterium]
DVPARQQTLRATIAWSLALLPEAARTLLVRLSVFAGGWTAESAAAVCATEAAPAETTGDHLATLVDVNLIARSTSPRGRVRYRMLETIREDGLERLAATGETASLRERHAREVLALAEAGPPYVPEARPDDWYERVDADLDNVRAALVWAETRGDPALLGRLAAALWPYWHEYLRVTEGRRWLETALARAQGLAPGQRASLLSGACILTSIQSAFQQGEAYGREALALWEQLGDDRGRAVVARQLGWCAMLSAGADAVTWYAAAVDAWRRVGNETGLARALSDLGVACFVFGDREAAGPYLDEAEELYRRAQDEPGLARALRDRGLYLLLSGDVAAAVPVLQEAVARLRATGKTIVLGSGMYYLGTALCFAGRLDEAANAYAESLQIHEEIADQGNLALTVLGCAALAHRRGDGLRAARLCGAAQGMRDASRTALPPAVEAVYRREIAVIVAMVGEPAFAASFADGRALTTSEALALARVSLAHP